MIHLKAACQFERDPEQLKHRKQRESITCF